MDFRHVKRAKEGREVLIVDDFISLQDGVFVWNGSTGKRWTAEEIQKGLKFPELSAEWRVQLERVVEILRRLNKAQ